MSEIKNDYVDFSKKVHSRLTPENTYSRGGSSAALPTHTLKTLAHKKRSRSSFPLFEFLLINPNLLGFRNRPP